jgi:hypothetical protein
LIEEVADFTPGETLFSFPEDNRKECLKVERGFLLLSMTERWLRAKLACVFEGG